MDAIVSGASVSFDEVLAKQGPVRMDLNATNTVPEVRAQAGTVLINGSCGPVQLDGGTIGGIGTVSQFYTLTGGSVAPGTGPNAGQQVIALTGTGIPGAPYVLEKSTDLLTWTPLQTVNATNAGTWSFTNTSQPLTTARFFVRVRLE